MLPYINFGKRLIPMYGVCMAVGILVSMWIAFVRTKRYGGDINSLIVICACAVGCGLVGAKVFYVVVSYGIGNAIHQMLEGDVSFLAEGGQVFYGGLVCGVMGALLGARLTHEKLTSYLEAIVPCVPLGHAFGRLGCFFAGCCHGMAYDGLFSVSFPLVGIDYQTFPVQLLETAVNICIFIYLICYTRKRRTPYHVLYRYVTIYAVSRFILEFMRGDRVRGISIGLSTSQWISIALIFIILFQMFSGKIGRKKGNSYN